MDLYIGGYQRQYHHPMCPKRGTKESDENELSAEFMANELENLQKELYRHCFEILGPFLVSVLSAWFQAYRNLKDSPNPLLRLRSERMGRYVRGALLGIYPAILFGPNRGRRAEVRRFLKDIENELGPLSVKERLQCWGTIPLSAWTWTTEKLGVFQQPRLLRMEHRF